ncbi:MAG: isoaspartyl peptidase/L-asparaginase [Desulfovibrionaceae bacterium]|jgi:beta-aspartyl-peptidase (threonine type)|nr:isoaspartyl peptidase/L-asparaginase [Desulfovibrionaceae bacterium]
MQPKLIVHGGAWDIPDEHVDAHLAGVRAAVEEVYPRLLQGMSALEAVERAVNVLEADPAFDAGRGAFLNADGRIELDAMIMDGARLDFGAVAGVRNLLHPVSLARRVLEAEDFRILIGEGAMRFARECGFVELDPRELLTERELAFYESIKDDAQFSILGSFGKKPAGPAGGKKPKAPAGPGSGPSDTVGAVALDASGDLACATSTGGTPRKHPGRVGDSPIIGCGGYADNELGAASATGYGEAILRVMLCRTACEGLRVVPETGGAGAGAAGAMDAARAAIDVLEHRAGGLGGVILLTPRGDFGFAHNTPRMAFATADEGGVRAAIAAR